MNSSQVIHSQISAAVAVLAILIALSGNYLTAIKAYVKKAKSNA